MKHALFIHDSDRYGSSYLERVTVQVETIPFKLNIRTDDENSRLASALISIQKEIPFYFGRVVNDLLTIEKQLLVDMPEVVQNDMQITFAELYNDEPTKVWTCSLSWKHIGS